MRVLLGLVGLAVFGFLGLLLFGTLTDWQPDPVMPAEALTGEARKTGPIDSTVSFAIWNVGYGGLGAEMDFFLDGGEHVQAPRDVQDKDLAGILSFADSRLRRADFVLLQEVDRDAKRSYGIDQAEAIAGQLPDHEGAFASNFRVKFIPVPLPRLLLGGSMGRVNGGLASYSRYTAEGATRYDFPGSYPWPKRIYHLDRCFLAQRYPAPGGAELVVVNTHNSAYDNGTLKAQEMDALRDFVQSEYEQGNYVVVGGDWNQCPPGFDPKTFKKEEDAYDQINIEADFLPGWTWAYDGSTPTNRKVATPYDPVTSFTTVIDFFLLSPNMDVVGVEGIGLDFAFSDHQPVLMTARLR